MGRFGDKDDAMRIGMDSVSEVKDHDHTVYNWVRHILRWLGRVKWLGSDMSYHLPDLGFLVFW